MRVTWEVCRNDPCPEFIIWGSCACIWRVGMGGGEPRPKGGESEDEAGIIFGSCQYVLNF